jgi:subtilase family serine protease
MLKNINEYKYGNDSLNVEEHFNKVLVNEMEKTIDNTFKNVLLKDLKIDLDQNKIIVSEVNAAQSKLDKTNKKLKHSHGMLILFRVLAILSMVAGVILLALSILGLATSFSGTLNKY